MTDGFARAVADRFRAVDRLVGDAAALLRPHTHATTSYEHLARRDDGATYTTKVWGATPRPY